MTMNGNYTFSIIKPNAIRTGKTGPILSMINEGGFEISAIKMVQMTLCRLNHFIEVHKGKSFFEELVELHDQWTRGGDDSQAR